MKTFVWQKIEVSEVEQMIGRAIKLNGPYLVEGELSAVCEDYIYVLSSEGTVIQYLKADCLTVVTEAFVATPIESLF